MAFPPAAFPSRREGDGTNTACSQTGPTFLSFTPLEVLPITHSPLHYPHRSGLAAVRFLLLIMVLRSYQFRHPLGPCMQSWRTDESGSREVSGIRRHFGPEVHLSYPLVPVIYCLCIRFRRLGHSVDPGTRDAGTDAGFLYPLYCRVSAIGCFMLHARG